MTRSITRMEIDDAAHYTAEQKAEIISAYPSWEQEARTKGLPSRGTGPVFKTAEDKLRCESFEIPKHFHQLIGVDFGFDHPFAAVRCAWDKDNDVWYVVASYRESGVSAPIHAAAVRPWGTWIPIAWPHDGLQHDKGSGDQLAGQYRAHGLNFLPEHATHEEGGFGITAGVGEMNERMETGRWKVFPGNDEWFGEYRLYHVEKGLIVKIRDDLLSASRYALMMRRFADATPRPRQKAIRQTSQHGWMG